MCNDTAVLARIHSPAREALLTVAFPWRVRRGETVLAEGERVDAFFIVAKGQLKMCRPTPSGRNLILALVGPDELVGVAGALSGAVSTASWEAVVDSELLKVKSRDLYALLAQRPELVGDLLPWLTRHLMECRNCLVETSCSRVESRFAALFLGLAEKIGQRVGGGAAIELPLSRQELADLTGTTQETAIRVMTRWAREGLVATRPEGFVVLDQPRLEALSLS